MKALLILIALSSLCSFSAFAKEASCKVKTNDIGTIVGHGADPSTAFEDAATQCFDRYSTLHKAKDHRDPADEDAQIVWIDTCANIKCG